MQTTSRQRRLLNGHDRISILAGRAAGVALAFRYCSAIGLMAERLGLNRIPSRIVSTVLPSISASQAKTIARSISDRHWLNRFTHRFVEARGYDDFQSGVISLCDEQLLQINKERQPTILVYMHCGPYVGISSTLHHLKIPALVFTANCWHQGNTSLILVKHSRLAAEVSAQRAYKQSLKHLNRGGIVMWSIDYLSQSSIGVKFFRRDFDFARGPFAAALRTGATIIPVTTNWLQERRIAVSLGPRLTQINTPGKNSSSPDVVECAKETFAMQVARWFEAHYRNHPEQMSAELLRNLASQQHDKPEADRL